MPTDVSIIEVTIAGTPAASTIVERGAHATERLLLQHDRRRPRPATRSRARVVDGADALVGGDRHVDAHVARARGRRSCATGCSTHSRS